jgi:hypothetical protein
MQKICQSNWKPFRSFFSKRLPNSDDRQVASWQTDDPRDLITITVLYGQGPYYNPTMRTSDGDVDYHGHTTGIITDIALEWLRLERDKDKPFMMIYNHKAPHREWLPGPALNDYQDRDLPEPSTLFYDYSGLTTAAHEQDMEISEQGGPQSMNWGRDLKVPYHPETGERNSGWESLINGNRLTMNSLSALSRPMLPITSICMTTMQTGRKKTGHGGVTSAM